MTDPTAQTAAVEALEAGAPKIGEEAVFGHLEDQYAHYMRMCHHHKEVGHNVLARCYAAGAAALADILATSAKEAGNEEAYTLWEYRYRLMNGRAYRKGVAHESTVHDPPPVNPSASNANDPGDVPDFLFLYSSHVGRTPRHGAAAQLSAKPD